MKIHCTFCKQETMHEHLHDSPYGIAGAHMAGSERFTCTLCGNSILVDEAKKRGFSNLFVLDKPHKGQPHD